MAHGGGEHSGGGGGAVRELLAVFGFGVETEELEKGENKLNEFMESVKKVAEGIAAAFMIDEIYEFAEANVHAMTQIEHAASRLGVSTEKVQEFQFAAKSMGMEAESLLNMMGRMQITQQAAAAGTGQAAQAFSKLGVHVKDSAGHMKTADELFLDVADGIEKIKDPSQAAALATQIFGRQGRELLPFLKEGRKGVEALGDEFKKLGGGYTEDAIKQGAKFEKQSARMDLALKSLKSTIMQAILPPITLVIEKLAGAVNWIRQVTEGSHVFEVALYAMAAAAAFFAAPMLAAAAPVLLLAAAIAAMVLVVDDLIGLFTGKDSEIGHIIDQLFGKDAHLDAIQGAKLVWSNIKDIVSELGRELKNIWDIYMKIIHGAEKVGGAIGDAAAKVVNKVREKTGIGVEGVVNDEVKASSAPWKKAAALGVQVEAASAFGADFAKEHHAVIRHGGMQIFGGGGSEHKVTVEVTASPELHAKVKKQIDDRGKAEKRMAANTFGRGSAQ